MASVQALLAATEDGSWWVETGVPILITVGVAVAVTVVFGCLLIGALTVRRVSPQSVAATLRSAL